MRTKSLLGLLLCSSLAACGPSPKSPRAASSSPSANPDGEAPRPPNATASDAAASPPKKKNCNGAGSKACAQLPSELLAIGRRCAAIDAESGEFGAAYNACNAVSNQAPKQAAAVARVCQTGNALGCFIHGALLSGRLTALWAHEIISPPCKQKAGVYCSTELQRRALVPFAWAEKSEEKALKAFGQSCKGGIRAACVEQLQLLEPKGGAPLREARQRACRQHGITASCSALVQGDAQTRLINPETIRSVQQVLSKQCIAGKAMACNTLGFGFEANLFQSNDKQPLEHAATHYAAACRHQAATGCANLIVFGLNHRAFARKLPYAKVQAQRQVTEGCDLKQDGLWPICFAQALALKRGLGGRARFRQGQKLMRTLCKNGYMSACRN